MKPLLRTTLLLAVFLSIATPSFSQMSITVGPQVALPLGLGVGATARVSPKLSVGAEINYAPLINIDYEGVEGSYTGRLRWLNANFTAHYHPNPTKRFAFMGGLYLGGLNYDLSMQETNESDIDADIWLGGPSLLLGLGWFGKGLTGGFGIAFPAKVSISADNEAVEEDVEEGNVEDIPTIALPYLKLGYQFGW